jgi:hypothetical protein
MDIGNVGLVGAMTENFAGYMQKKIKLQMVINF